MKTTPKKSKTCVSQCKGKEKVAPDEKLEEATATINARLRQKYKYDCRGPNVVARPVEAHQVNPTLAIAVDASANAFKGPILAAISHAVIAGFSLFAEQDDYLWWSFRYQLDLLLQAAKGGIPAAAMVPRWLNLLCQAVTKTTVNEGGLSISYQFNITDTADTAYDQTIGPVTYGRKFLMGLKVPFLINGVYSTSAPPGAYTTALGEQATQSLWLFLTNQHKDDKMHEMVPVAEENIMTNDVSAFAWFQNSPGNGYSQCGGMFKQIFHEVGIRHPLFSVFAPKKNLILTNRAQNMLRKFSGDGITTGSLLIDTLDLDQLAVKHAPKVKFLDFNEYFDVLGLAMVRAAEIRTEDPEFLEALANNPNFFEDVIQCPLTCQNAKVLLKNTIMLVLQDTYRWQGVYPRTPTSITDQEFQVYPCGVNTAPLSESDMMILPQIFTEGILACTSRTVEAGRSGHKNPNMLHGVLGQYANVVPRRTDYTVTYIVDGLAVTKSVFADDTGEVEINLIDGSYTGGYTFINDPSIITVFSALWNEWIQANGDNYRMLNLMSTDNGIDALSMIPFTQYFFNVTPDAKPPRIFKRDREDKKEPVKTVILAGKDCNRKLVPKSNKSKVGSNLYLGKAVVALTSSVEIFQSPWVQFQQYMVKPIMNVTNTSSDDDNTGFFRVAAFYGETNTLAFGIGDIKFIQLRELHENWAAQMVKTRLAAPSELDDILKSLAREGSAGILGKLAGALVGNLGAAAIQQGAEVLGEVIPF
jgi:hypothetical protein